MVQASIQVVLSVGERGPAHGLASAGRRSAEGSGGGGGAERRQADRGQLNPRAAADSSVKVNALPAPVRSSFLKTPTWTFDTHTLRMKPITGWKIKLPTSHKKVKSNGLSSSVLRSPHHLLGQANNKS